MKVEQLLVPNARQLNDVVDKASLLYLCKEHFQVWNVLCEHPWIRITEIPWLLRNHTIYLSITLKMSVTQPLLHLDKSILL